MTVLGLIITIIVYTALLLLFGFYEFLVIKKKFNFANLISKFLFLSSLLAVALESWALIMINGGFDVYLKLKVDFSYSAIIIVVLCILLAVSGFIVSRKAMNESIVEKIASLLLPAFTMVGIGASTILLFFNIVYFKSII